ncbi:MAG TPA: hypothetical protein VN179_02780 [Solirubrobacterales bacterium]|nr:hypothetical protein [Solirubrobacterales bacterium]
MLLAVIERPDPELAVGNPEFALLPGTDRPWRLRCLDRFAPPKRDASFGIGDVRGGIAAGFVDQLYSGLDRDIKDETFDVGTGGVSSSDPARQRTGGVPHEVERGLQLAELGEAPGKDPRDAEQVEHVRAGLAVGLFASDGRGQGDQAGDCQVDEELADHPVGDPVARVVHRFGTGLLLGLTGWQVVDPLAEGSDQVPVDRAGDKHRQRDRQRAEHRQDCEAMPQRRLQGSKAAVGSRGVGKRCRNDEAEQGGDHHDPVLAGALGRPLQRRAAAQPLVAGEEPEPDRRPDRDLDPGGKGGAGAKQPHPNCRHHQHRKRL